MAVYRYLCVALIIPDTLRHDLEVAATLTVPASIRTIEPSNAQIKGVDKNRFRWGASYTVNWLSKL
jgi:hypothetical protein